MTETFSLDLDGARRYETLFVPALFAQWVPPLLGHASLAAGHRVLDVACGTGVVARAAADIVGPSGHVVGLDLSPAMLHIASEVAPHVEWCLGDAGRLPFDAASFDVVFCQSALFFFPDPAAAVREMARVVAPSGTVVLQTYAGLAEQPGYGPFVEVVVRHAGPSARSLLDTYWSMGDSVVLRSLLEAAGLLHAETATRLGTVTFPDVRALMRVEVGATPLAHRIDNRTYAAIEADAASALDAFRHPAGGLTLPIRARFAAARAG